MGEIIIITLWRKELLSLSEIIVDLNNSEAASMESDNSWRCSGLVFDS